ncbi:PilW family protein [Caldanaerobacter sp.]|uniref:PilW family protein n=1 Tax=Caldanaerobacter sp. TaxID=2930036 RepID=UPI003C76259B
MVVKKEGGFTLIELIVTLAILGIVLSVYSSLYYSGYKSFESTESSVEVEQNVRFAMNYIMSQLNKGPDEVVILNGGKGLQINWKDSSANTVKSVIIKLDEKKHTLYLDDNKGHELATKIYDFKVTQKGPSMINIYIKGQRNDRGLNEFSLSNDFFLRKSDVSVK